MGSDRLFGDGGADILIGDIEYCTHRYLDIASPLTRTDGSWHKDIVLEEIGNITNVARISQKMDPTIMSAESIAAASLLFVANAHGEDGTKYLDPETGEWITDLFTFNLEAAFDDYLDGGTGNDGEHSCSLFSVSNRFPNTI